MAKVNELIFEKTFRSQNGIVVGKCYGGGKGTYPTRDFKADTEKELKEKINKALDLGSLDDGMGFEKLIAAGVQIVEITTVEIDGKKYTNETVKNWVTGDTDLFNQMVEDGGICDDLAKED